MNDQELFEQADQIENAKDDVLESLREDLFREQVKPGDFTKYDAMEYYGLSIDQVTRKLKELVEQGKLMMFKVGGKNYYRKLDKVG